MTLLIKHYKIFTTLTLSHHPSMPRYRYALLLLLFATGCTYDNAEKIAPACGTPAEVSYQFAISPLLDRNCRSCHNAALLTGNVNLEDFAEIQRRAGTGQLIGVVSHAPGFPEMPKYSPKLSDCDIALLKKWVDAGAPNN